ncbi:MAG TPA: ABC transporter permease, partial [Vicinamibacterales bacterium]|nr:ABC transporter permease [Vicinamibacterales bacterium]
MPLSSEQRAEAEADLQELYAARADEHGHSFARRRFYRDVVSLPFGSPPSDRNHGVHPPGPLLPIGELAQDVRYSARLLLKSPGFTAVAVLSLALGIGVNTAVLAVVRAVLLAPLPVPEPHELATAHWWRADEVRGMMQINSGGANDPRSGRNLSTNYDYLTYTALRDSVADRADLFALTFMRQANIALDGQPVTGGGMLVSGNYFRGMRVPMQLGRGIDDQDERPDGAPVAVLGFGMWRRAFGGDPAILGKSIRVNGHPFTVIGVTAREYYGVSKGGFYPPTDVTVPLTAQPLVAPRWTPQGGSLFDHDKTLWLRAMVRLKPGADLRQVETTLSNAFHRRLNETTQPVAAGAEAPLITLLDGARGLDSLGKTLEQPLMMLGVVAALVFLIACVNIASLVLVRAVARQQEFWIRLSLGAGRARLIRQSIVESVLIAGAGGALGVLLASWAGPAIVSTIAGSAPNAVSVGLDLRLITLSAAVSAVAALLFGVIPSLRLASRNNADLMRQTGGGASAPRLRAGRTLVIVQVAIAVPLVVGAALFLRTIHNLASVELGFEPRNVVLFKMDPTLNGYAPERTQALYRQVLERLQSVPGVHSATLVENALLSGWVSNTSFSAEGQKPRSTLMNRVGPGFFETMGLPIVGGRGLGLQDGPGATPTAVINEAAGRRFFAGTNPVGQSLVMAGAEPVRLQVVGVARDAKYSSVKAEVVPTIYLPYLQSTGLGAMHVAVRSGDGIRALPAIRAAVAEVDRDVPITAVKTQAQQIDEAIGSERALTTLLVFFGVFALLLACIGLHGVTAYSVARRTSEIGIRLALGAQRSSVQWMILKQVVWLAVAGLAIGIPAAIFGSRAVGALLYGVQPADPWSVMLGAGILLAVALFAGFIPARRASRLDPLIGLRR